MMKKTILSLFLVLVFLTGHTAAVRGFQAYATHVSGNTYRITGEVFVRTTAPGSTSVEITWGDGTSDTLVLTTTPSIPSMNLSVASFESMHTFSSNGTYACNFTISNWDSGILNMTNPDTRVCVGSLQIVISPFLGHNQFNGFNYSLEDGNVTADDYSLDLSGNDPDGDSLMTEQQTVSELSTPSDYQYPSSFGGSESIVGHVYHFDNIVAQGPYVVSFATKEFRSGMLIASHIREYVIDYPAGLAGMEALNNGNPISLYPNPGFSSVYVATAVPENFGVYDLNGQLLFTGITNQQVNIAALASGLYFVRTSSGSNLKLVKE